MYARSERKFLQQLNMPEKEKNDRWSSFVLILTDLLNDYYHRHHQFRLPLDRLSVVNVRKNDSYCACDRWWWQLRASGVFLYFIKDKLWIVTRNENEQNFNQFHGFFQEIIPLMIQVQIKVMAKLINWAASLLTDDPYLRQFDYELLKWPI